MKLVAAALVLLSLAGLLVLPCLCPGPAVDAAHGCCAPALALRAAGSCCPDVVRPPLAAPPATVAAPAMPAAYTPLDAVPVVLRIARPHHAACAPVPILRI